MQWTSLPDTFLWLVVWDIIFGAHLLSTYCTRLDSTIKLLIFACISVKFRRFSVDKVELGDWKVVVLWLWWRHIPDVRARASRLFLALNKRGDFKIWSDEFEELCDVIAKEVERQPESALLKRRRSNPDMHFVKHPFYNYVIWALTLCSLSFAIAALNVRSRTLLHLYTICLYLRATWDMLRDDHLQLMTNTH